MYWLINLGANVSGYWNTIQELLPLLGALGGILGVASAIAMRSAAAHNAADLLAALHPTASESATLALSIGLIKSHFNHQQNQISIQALKTPAPPST